MPLDDDVLDWAVAALGEPEAPSTATLELPEWAKPSDNPAVENAVQVQMAEAERQEEAYRKLARAFAQGGESRALSAQVRRTVPDSDRERFTQILAEEVRQLPEPDRGALSKAGTRFLRGIRTSEANLRKFAELIAGTDEQSDDEAFEARANAIRRDFDKAEPDPDQGRIAKWISGGALSASEMAPQMVSGLATGVATGGPAGPMAFWYGQIAPNRYEEFRQEGFSDNESKVGALITAAPEALIEMIQAKQLLPSSVRRQAGLLAGKATRGAMKQWAKGAGKTYVLELTEEALQEASALTTEAVMEQINGEVDIDWQAEFGQSADQLVQAAAALPFLMGPGVIASGIQTAREAGPPTTKPTQPPEPTPTQPPAAVKPAEAVSVLPKAPEALKPVPTDVEGLATPAGAAAFAEANPKLASEFATADRLSRKRVQGTPAGPLRVSAAKRATFLEHLKTVVQQPSTVPPRPGSLGSGGVGEPGATTGPQRPAVTLPGFSSGAAPQTKTPAAVPRETAQPPAVPPERTLPNATNPSEPRVPALLDEWQADRDDFVQQAHTNTANLQDDIKEAVGTRIFGKAAKNADQAIQLYIDLKGKEKEQIGKWYDKLTKEQQAVVDASQKLSPELKALGDRIIEQNDRMGIQALENDVITNVVENYNARLWEAPPTKLGESLTAAFRTKTARAKPRTFESILEGWAAGKKLRVVGATNSQNVARTQVAQVIVDRNLLKTAKQAKLIATSRVAADWVPVEHPNFNAWEFAGKVPLGDDAGKLPSGPDFRITDDGVVLRRRQLYAEPELGKALNRILGRSKLRGIPFIDVITRWNSIIKHTILVTALFHHQAFMRSSMLGSMSANAKQSYEQGREAIKNYTPEVQELVRGGLTIGRVQDWDEFALQEKTAIGKVIDKVPMARWIKDKLLELRDRQTDFLFKKFGASLKVQAALLEYRSLLRKNKAKLEAGDVTSHELAQLAAKIANDDFGGLHLARMQRDPTVQHLFQLFTLAPDWTESNVRSAVKAFQGGREGEVYRAFWSRILLKGLGVTILGNLVLSAFDDDDFWERYQKQWKEGNLRWLDIDVTPIYRAFFGGGDEKRKFFSLIGHFRDPLKFILHPARSVKHKGSVLTRAVADAWTGTDWAGRRFTTVSELMGVDDKGVYKTTVKGKRKAGDPKGGKLKGQLVSKQRGGGGSLGWGSLPSFLVLEARQSLPIPLQSGIAWLTGEQDGFDAISKSLGLMTATTFPEKPLEAIRQAAADDEPKAARAAFRRLVDDESAESGRAYVGRQVVNATAPLVTERRDREKLKDFRERRDKRNTQIAESFGILKALGIGPQEARRRLRSSWIRRGADPTSGAFDARSLRLSQLYLRARIRRRRETRTEN